MISTDCLESKRLIQYNDGRLHENENKKIMGHLAECELCARNLLMLKQIDKILSMKGRKYKINIHDLKEKKECISDDLLYRYLEGTVTKAEAGAIQRHLNSCMTCFNEMASLLRNSLFPATDSEKIEIAKMRILTPEEQVSKILSVVEQECPPTAKVKTGLFAFIPELWERIKAIIPITIPFGTRWRLAIAFASIIIFLVSIGRPQYKIWRSNVLTDRGISYLTGVYAITSREEPRPVGGFEYYEFGPPRSEDTVPSYEPAKATLEKALHLNSKNLSAHHYLGTYYLLVEKSLDKAREQYMLVFSQDSTNASILNDLGIVAWYRGDYDDAAEKFSLALKYDPHLLEAQYNLAVLYQKQGKIEKAKKEWEKYLNLDSTFTWADVARDRLDHLRQK